MHGIYGMSDFCFLVNLSFIVHPHPTSEAAWCRVPPQAGPFSRRFVTLAGHVASRNNYHFQGCCKTMSMTQSIEHIVSDPEIAFGKPRIAGTRFSVKDVVIDHLFNGMPLELIAADYDLPLAGVYAAMSYYYDHKEPIDRSIEDEKQFVEQFRANYARENQTRFAPQSR